MDRETELFAQAETESVTPYSGKALPKVTDRITRAELSQRIKDSVAVGNSEHLHCFFNFMLVNEYTPEQLVQEIDYTRAQNEPMLKTLVQWTEQVQQHKKQKTAGKATYLAIVIQHAENRFAQTLRTIEKYKKFADAPHEFTEAVDLLAISSWLGLLQQEQDSNVPNETILKQLEALRQKHIWSKELAQFAIPVTTAYFRDQSIEKLATGNYTGAYRDLEQALQLPEEDKSMTYQAYASCIARQINDPLFRARAKDKDLEKLEAKMEFLTDVDFWSPELDISRFHLKGMTGSI
ncbi:hypothetical protein [Endozoicomonas sp. OPT23]|uniref:hypothetical protein n=1 Tax=Endozoicomonas sp. OPT23 TaxID=2072845 RepID=UPI00129B113D|nr:hypothetical protein [Endozoicomonas sp. OPT23]